MHLIRFVAIASDFITRLTLLISEIVFEFTFHSSEGKASFIDELLWIGHCFDHGIR